MSVQTALQIMGGWSIGSRFTAAKKREDEVKQGGNYVLSALDLTYELLPVSDVVYRVISLAISHPILRGVIQLVCTITPALALPVVLGAGFVRQGYYQNLQLFFNRLLTPRLSITLPTELSTFATDGAHFIAEHLGDLLRVVMVVSSIGLTVFGSYALGGACLTALTYEFLDTKGFIPRKISLFIETYLPTVTLIGTLWIATPLSALFTLYELANKLSPEFNQAVQQKYAQLLNSLYADSNNVSMAADSVGIAENMADMVVRMQRGLPTLEEIDAPNEQHYHLSNEEIRQILFAERGDRDFEFDPSHGSKAAGGSINLPENRDLGQFLTLFDRINWQEKPHLIMQSLRTDDRFLAQMRAEFPQFEIDLGPPVPSLSEAEEEFDDFDMYQRMQEARQARTEEVVRQRSVFENYFHQMARARNLSPAAFAASHLRGEFTGFISFLRGDVRVQGSQEDLDEAIHMSYKLLPYLECLAGIAQRGDAEDSTSGVIAYLMSTLNQMMGRSSVTTSGTYTLSGNRETELEDALLKLAIEGGKYCARGLKRATSELMGQVIRSYHPEPSDSTVVADGFESRILGILQDKRHETFANVYGFAIRAFPAAVGQDVHVYDVVKRFMSLGFYPLTQQERFALGFFGITAWSLILHILMHMPFSQEGRSCWDLYRDKFGTAIEEAGGTLAAYNFIQEKILSNPSLNPAQREELIELYTERNGDEWTFEETIARFNTLMFVMLGVLRRRTSEHNPVSIFDVLELASRLSSQMPPA